MIFGQEDYNAAVQDEAHQTLNYITRKIDDPQHDDCVFLRLMDCSCAADEWVKKQHPNRNYPECSVEVLVTPEEMKEIRKIMLKLLKAAEERGW